MAVDYRINSITFRLKWRKTLKFPGLSQSRVCFRCLSWSSVLSFLIFSCLNWFEQEIFQASSWRLSKKLENLLRLREVGLVQIRPNLLWHRFASFNFCPLNMNARFLKLTICCCRSHYFFLLKRLHICCNWIHEIFDHLDLKSQLPLLNYFARFEWSLENSINFEENCTKF